MKTNSLKTISRVLVALLFTSETLARGVDLNAIVAQSESLKGAGQSIAEVDSDLAGLDNFESESEVIEIKIKRSKKTKSLGPSKGRAGKASIRVAGSAAEKKLASKSKLAVAKVGSEPKAISKQKKALAKVNNKTSKMNSKVASKVTESKKRIAKSTPSIRANKKLTHVQNSQNSKVSKKPEVKSAKKQSPRQQKVLAQAKGKRLA